MAFQIAASMGLQKIFMSPPDLVGAGDERRG